MDNAQASFLNGVSGTLVNVNSAAEMAHLNGIDSGSNWLGASDKLQDRIWRWYNGDSPSTQFWNGSFTGAAVNSLYSNWNGSEPNGGTGEMYAHTVNGSDRWNDSTVSNTMASFVEWTGADYRAATGVASSVMENASAGTVVGTLSASDPDSGETYTYALVGGATSKFQLVGNQLQVKTGATFDYESTPVETLTVRVTDSGGLTRDLITTINVVNVNETPTDTGLVTGANLIANGSFETGFTTNAGWGYQGNSVSGWSLDAGSAFNVTNTSFGMTPSQGTYWLDMQNSADNITISQVVSGLTNGAAYQLSVDARAFNFNSNTYGDGADVFWGGQKIGTIMEATGWQTFQFNLLGGAGDGTNKLSIVGMGAADNEGLAIDNIQLYALQTSNPTLTLAENLGVNTFVGQVGSTDPDAYGVLTYSLANNAGGAYAINSSTGVLTVASSSLLNFETTPTTTIVVRTTDQGGLTYDKTLTINLTDVNDSPAAVLNLDTATEAGGVANGTAGTNPTGNVLTNDTDEDAGDTKTVVGVAAGTAASASGSVASAVTGTYGSITIAADGTYSYTVNNNDSSVQALRSSSDTLTDIFTYSIQDAAGVPSTTQITITIQGANDTPYDLAATGLTISENATNGTNVATITRSDRDASDTPSYSLTNSAGGRFAIDANTGAITVANSSLLDYEAATSHNVTVRVTDLDGATYDEVFTINLTDVNEAGVGAISDTNIASDYVLENASNGTVVGITAHAVDPDGTDVVTYSLDDNAGGRFAIDANTGVITVAGPINREAAGSYNITIRATSSDSSTSTCSSTITIGDVNEFATSAITDSVPSVNSVVENASIGTTVGITASASDSDATTNTITYSLFDDDGGNFAIDANTGVVTTAVMFNREASGPSRNITVRATSADGSHSDQLFTIAINDVNESSVTAPVDSNATTNTVNENASIGTLVGITASSSDSDATTNTVTYSLFDNDSGNFTIDANTGVVTTAAMFNREASGPSRNITIRATSADGSTADTTFTININDLDEFDTSAISDTNAAANSLAENSANGTAVGITASASDSDATTNVITYSLDDNAGGRFTVNSSTGVVTVADSSLLDYESAISHNITVRATSADTSFTTRNFTINLTDVNEASVGAISDTNATSNYVLENASNGTVVGVTGHAVDPDGTDVVTYSFDDNAGGRFAIDANTGVVTVAGPINRESAGSYDITIRATSTDSSTSTSTITITIGDVNEFATSAVSDSNATANSVAENASIGTTVGITASASDSDATTNTITYSLFDDDGGNFAIDSNTGVVTTAVMFNREASGPSRNITVRATSADGSHSDQTFTIAITDANESAVTAPVDANASTNAVNENASIGTLVGITASSSDADATTNTVTYTLFDDDSGNFTIDANTGVVTTAAMINREASGPSRNITIRATSADGSTADTTFNININDLDEFDTSAISDNNASANTLTENSSNGTVVGITAFASDSDATTNAITYSLDDNAGGRFTINSSTGVVTVADSSLLDYESAISHNITVRATSADTSFTTRNFTINLTDVNEASVGAISDTNGTSNYVLENASNGTLVGIAAQAVDPDGTDVVTYSLDDNAGGRFTIDANTGVVAVANAIDRESSTTYDITIRATSTDSSTSTSTITITIGDVNEFATSAVSDSNATANSVAENASIGTTVGITASASDSDATTNTITYSLFDDDGGNFAIDANTGVVTTAVMFNREASGPSRNITVRATSADGSHSDQLFTIAINDVNESSVTAPVDSNATTNTVNENASIGTLVGITASSSDSDATTNTVTYSLFDNDSGNFTIDANTGVVTTATMFNREASGPSRNITIRATSADGSTADTTFTININDLDEFDTSAISDTNAAANTLAENSANGTVVGITASASDSDATTNAITYSLDDNAGGRFTVNSSTGVVTVADSSLLDYESAISHNITVRATSADTSSTTRNFTINLTDVNESGVGAISDTNAASNYVLENATNGTVVGVTAHAVDPDGTDVVTYSLDDNAGGRFTIDANTGVVTVAGAINREAAGSYDITIRATSTDSSTVTSTYTITIGDVNEFATSALTDSVPSVNSVVENASIGTTVGITASAFDSDATTNSIMYSMTDSDGGRFTVDPSTGVVSVSAAIDREADGPTRTVTIRATSDDGSYSEQSFLINVYDVDEFDVGAIGDSDLGANAVAENSAIGTVVNYQAIAIDADATNNLVTYSLDDNAGGRFAIDSITGIVTVADSAGLNYETNASHSIIVRAVSADSSWITTTVTIAVLDVNERPTAFADNYATSFIDVLRALSNGVLLNDTDPDGDTLTMQLISGPAIGILDFAGNGVFSYTPVSGFEGQVTFVYQAFDGQLASDPIVVTIDVFLPVGGSGGTGGGSGGSGNSDGGSNGSGTSSGGGSTETTPSDTPPGATPVGGIIDVATNAPTPFGGEQSKPNSVVQSAVSEQVIGLIDSVETKSLGELAVANSQRTLRSQFEQWAGQRELGTTASRDSSEQFVIHGMSLSEADQSAERENSNGALSISIGAAVSTAIGTGAILWVVQATQLAATFISAASPTWMQVDIASALNSLAKEKNASDEVSAKMFEK